MKTECDSRNLLITVIVGCVDNTFGMTPKSYKRWPSFLLQWRYSCCYACAGHQYQGFDVRYNYLAFNNVSYRNIFAAFGVQLNFTSNIVYNNTGQCILNASVLEMVPGTYFILFSQQIIIIIIITRVPPRWVDMISRCHHQWGTGRALLSLKAILIIQH